VERGFPPGALFGDRAILGLTTADAWRAPVLLGPYSRFYWHHPGPLYFYVLNVLSALFGGGTVGLVLGAVAVNAAAAAGIFVVAMRRGGRALLVWSAVLLAAYLFAIDPVPYDVWNPSVTLLPFALVLLLGWSVTCGDWWAIPWLGVVGSFVVQTHVGLAPGVAFLVGFVTIVCVVRRRRAAAPPDGADQRTLGWALLVGVAVTVVAWLPPLIEELTTSRGNLSQLLEFFTRHGTDHTLSEGVTNTALQSTLMVRGLLSSVSLMADAHQGLTLALVVSAIALGCAIAAAVRARATDTLLLIGLGVAELAVGVYAVMKIAGPVQYYLVQWISAIGFVLWIAVGRAGLDAARAPTARSWRSPARRRGALAVALVVLGVLTMRALPGHAGLINENLDVPNNRALFGHVPARQLLAATRSGRTVVLRNDVPTGWEVLAADALLLEQHGRTVRIASTRETRLLFDDARLVSRASDAGRDADVLSFRDRDRPNLRPGDTVVAPQGEWLVVHDPEP
jgi:hypothetical protein